MSALEIPATSSTPATAFHYEKGELNISGRSLDRNADRFYEPLINWINEYATKPRPQTILYLYLEYANTPSSKCVFSILEKLKLLGCNGTSIVIVKWKYDAEDEQMLDCGQMYSELLEMPFEFIEAA